MVMFYNELKPAVPCRERQHLYFTFVLSLLLNGIPEYLLLQSLLFYIGLVSEGMILQYSKVLQYF